MLAAEDGKATMTTAGGRRSVAVPAPATPDTVAGVPVQGRALSEGWGGLGAPFVRFLTAATISMYGDWLTTVALVVLLARLVGPAAPAGYMLARVLPRLVSGAPGGALADRFSPNVLVGGCAVVQGGLTLSIVFSASHGVVWAIYAAVVLAQFAGGLARPSMGCMVPRVAPPWRLQKANALYGMCLSSSIAVGPALAAPLLRFATPEALLVADAVSFGIAAVGLLTVRLLPVAATASVPMRGATAGLRIAWRHPALRTLAAAYLSSGMVATAAASVLVLAARELGRDSVVPFLYVAVGLGSLIAGAVALRVKPQRVGRDVIVACTLLEIVVLTALSGHAPLWGMLAALAVTGGSGMLWQTWGATELQQRTAAAMLGRVNAVMVVAASVGMLLGALVVFALIPVMGWEHALFAACCAAIALLAAGTLAGPAIPAVAAETEAA